MTRPERRVLPNGLTVVVEPVPSAPVFTAMLVVEAGSRYDPPGRAGLAALTGGLLMEGTTECLAGEMALAVDSLGSALDSITGYETTVVVASGLSEHCAETLGLLSEVVTAPLLTDASVSECVRRQLSELADDEAQAYDLCRQSFMRTLFREHPRANPVGGLSETVSRLARGDVDDLYRRCYRPSRSVLTVAGDLSTPEMLDAAESRFGHWVDADGGPVDSPAPPQSGGGRRLEATAMDSKQVHVIVGNVAITRSDPLFYAASVMDVILGDSAGFGSRLSTRLRENEGLAYVIESDASGTAGIDPGVFWAYSACSPGSFDQLLDGLMEELGRMRSVPPSDDEVSAAIGYLTGRDLLDRETSDAIAGRLVHAERHGLGLDFDRAYPGIVSAVTRDEVLSAAQRVIDPESFTLAVVGPVEPDDVSFPDEP